MNCVQSIYILYGVPNGVSYNSYLLLDEKTVLFDTVDKAVYSVFLENLAHGLDGRALDYLVITHMEPDHAATQELLLERYPQVKIVCNAKIKAMIGQFFPMDLEGRFLIVKEGDTLNTGKHSFSFVMAPMVHWPEVMMSYDAADKVLFTADAFGTFGALNGRLFADEADFFGEHLDEARRYYFNIVGKYGPQVQAVLAKAAALPIRTIRPLHGPILEDNLEYYIGLYDTWSRYDSETDGIFIAVASIHGGTMAAAQHLAHLLSEKGAPKVVLSDLCRSDFAENVEDAFRYPKLILAASSYDAGVFTPMHEFLHRLQIKGYCRRKVGVIENGSWAPSAARVMKEMLSGMKEIELLEPTVTIRSRMKRADLPALEALADAVLS